MASISQFISITSLIQGGVTGATRVAFYGPVATGDMKKASVVYKTSQSFYTKFALALSGYVAVLAVVYPKFVETPFSYIDALLLVLVLQDVHSRLSMGSTVAQRNWSFWVILF